MMTMIRFVIAALPVMLAQVVQPAPEKLSSVILYNRKVVPPTWSQVARAARNQKVHFTVAIKQQNLDKLEAKFWAVSDPKSPEWQKFMTKAEIGALVAAKAEHINAVSKWLKASLSKHSIIQETADSIDVRTTVGECERLFDAQLFIFAHDMGHTVIRTFGTHSVPQEVFEAIDFVEGISDFPMHRPSARKVPKGKQDPDAITTMVAPQTLQEMYSVPADRVLSKVSQGPVEFQGDQSYNKEDLVTFFKQTKERDEKVPVSDIVGPFDGTFPDTEATLDVQYLLSVGQNQTNWYWTSDNWMYQWSHNFFNHETVPDAVSISWGWAEDGQCTQGIDAQECHTLGIDSATFVQRVNTEFQKIGLRGVSIFVASGDSGANGRSDGGCTGTVLHASFPASSPYVTAVGATMLQDAKYDLTKPPPACASQGSQFKCASGGTEVSVSSQQAGFTSGGGFSTYTPGPAYQKHAVSEYLKSGTPLPPPSYFNSSNRAFPDVSAMGNNFLIYMQVEGGFSLVGGTSASSPSFAGVAAYLNDLSYKKKGKPLGFLNPLLYKMHAEQPDAFTDVTIGDNKCTEDGCFATCKGYEAAKGWDPVSGLGTPVADKMISYVEKLLDQSLASAPAESILV